MLQPARHVALSLLLHQLVRQRLLLHRNLDQFWSPTLELPGTNHQCIHVRKLLRTGPAEWDLARLDYGYYATAAAGSPSSSASAVPSTGAEALSRTESSEQGATGLAIGVGGSAGSAGVGFDDWIGDCVR
jgi:hypothetical protein